MGKPPWFKMDPSKFLQDGLVDAMTTEELGCSFRLLCRQWVDGYIPNDPDLIARLCRVNRSAIDKAWPILSMFFPEIEDGTKRANRFMWHEREMTIQAMAKKESDGREAVNKRWSSIRNQKETNRSPIADLIQDKDKDKDKELPPLPPKGGNRLPKPKLKKTNLPEMDINPEIKELANGIISACPETQPDGKTIRIDTGALVGRLENILETAKTESKPITHSLLSQAWEMYLESKPMAFKAPQYFFGDPKNQGPNGANWIEWARIAYTRTKAEVTHA